MSKTLTMYTIYDSPTDYPPGTIVVRQWEIREYSRVAVPMGATAHATLESARASIPKNYVRTLRADKDDPKIIETWL